LFAFVELLAVVAPCEGIVGIAVFDEAENKVRGSEQMTAHDA